MDPPLPFGALLKRLRNAARTPRMTQAELAAKAGFSVVFISMLERGTRQPTRATIALLADALGLGTDERSALEAAAHLMPGDLPASRAASAPPSLPVGGFLGAIPEGPIVARETEVAQLLEALEAIADGAGRLVLLAGEPGIGKTRLAQEVAMVARGRGYLVITGRCYEPQAGVAYYPFLEALHGAYAAAPASIRAELPHRWSEVARLLPDQQTSTSLPGASANGSGDQQRLFWQVTGFLQTLAEARPVALLLDDLHWVDHASIDLLLHLARHTRALPFLLLGTYRDDEVSRKHPLEGALRDLSRDHLLERVRISHLSFEGTRALVAATLEQARIPDALTQLLYARTEGNPFFTCELVRALREQGGAIWQQGDWDPQVIEAMDLPESIRSVIGQRVGRLSPAAQGVLHEASVLGQTFAFEDLVAMNARDEGVVDAALEEGAVVGLVREAGGDRLGFYHALVQQALYRELTARRRHRLHRKAGEAIERLPERTRQLRSADLAYHFRAADEKERALPYILLAGDQAEAVYAHAEAERHFRAAIEVAHALSDEHSEALALEKLGRVLWLVGREGDAQEVLACAAQAYRAVDDLDGELRAIAQTLPIHGSRGTSEEGLARVQPLIAVAETRGEPGALRGLVSAYTGLAALYAKCGHFRDQLAAATRAEELARALRDDRMLVPALHWRALATANLGVEDPLPLFLDLVSLAERVGDRWILSRALNNVAVTFEFNGDLARGLPYLDRALVVAEQLGSPPEIALKLVNRASQTYSSGDWRRAREDCVRAASIVQRYGLTGDSWLATYPHLWLGALDLVEGRDQAGEQHLMAALTLAQHTGDLVAQRHVAWILAERDLLGGNAAVALERLKPLLDRPGHQEADVERLLPLMAWAEADIGLQEQAVATITLALARCRQVWRVHALRVLAMLLAREQRYDEAFHAIEESLALCLTIADPYAEAKALYVYGQVLLKEGKPGQARKRFEAAQAICERLGEGLYRAHIERALGGLQHTSAMP
jgi:tetratricopeptide (TPR) repeat protein/transcriptional regulator with XRE-family HTH domain